MNSRITAWLRHLRFYENPRSLLCVLIFFGLVRAVIAADAAPNIIFILADDLGYGDLGSYGQKEIKTPNLDRLAAEGVRFTDAYAGATVCAPSRCVLMTGLHTGHIRVRGNSGQAAVLTTEAVALQPTDHTVATMLKTAGYATGLVGKWGLGNVGGFESGLPTRQGFDYFYGYLSQTHAHNSYPSFLWRNETRIALPNIVPNEAPIGSGVSSNKAVFAEDLFIDEALKFVRQESGRPFFLYFAPTLPHANDESTPIGLEIPEFGDYAKRDWPEAEQRFAAIVTRLDTDVGRIMALLRELKLEKNTLVIFASDNGPHKEGGQDPEFFHSRGGLRGIKRSMYEGGVRVPAMARWPGKIPAGVVNSTPWSFADVMPTFAALSGVTSPASDGVNVWSAFVNKPAPELQNRSLYWEFYEGGFKQAARRGNWKAVKLTRNGAIELYDLKTDLAETKNVAALHPDIVKEFETYLKESHTESPYWPSAERAAKPKTKSEG